jgi:hypothetical protein
MLQSVQQKMIAQRIKRPYSLHPLAIFFLGMSTVSHRVHDSMKVQK